jgi:hypothetical protein
LVCEFIPFSLNSVIFLKVSCSCLIYALIVTGIDELIGMIISPILSVGFDIGKTFTAGAS